MSRNMRSAALRFSERISDSSRSSSSIRSDATPSATSWSPFMRNGSLRRRPRRIDRGVALRLRLARELDELARELARGRRSW